MIEFFLKELKKKGFKQVDIASKAEVSQAQISRYSKGEKPSIDVVLKLADAFQVSTDHILGRDNQNGTSCIRHDI